MKKKRIVLTLFAVVFAAICSLGMLACAKKQAQVYTLTLDANGGAFDGGEYVLSYTVKHGDNLGTSVEPTKTGSVFDGWSLDANGGAKVVPTEYAVEKDTTFYAVWKKNEYTVKFLYNYDGAPDGGVYKTVGGIASGDKISAPIDPTRDGHTFVKWTHDANGNDDWSFADNTVSENIELYAQWEKDQTVIPQAELVGIVIESKPTKTVYNVGEELDLSGMVVKALYSDRSEKTVDACDCTVKGYDKTKSGVQTITVEYEGKTDEFTVTVNKVYRAVKFDKNTEYEVTGMPETQNVEDGKKATAPLTAPVCKGFTFEGWYCGDVAWNFDDAVTQEVTLSAKWAAKSYTVKYMVTGGDDPATQVYTAEDGVFGEFDLATPQKEHHAFDGWYESSAHEGEKKTRLSYADIPATKQEIILYGTFIAETYDITFEFGGGADSYTATWADDFTAPASYTYGQRITLPTAADIVITPAQGSSAVYNFAGWKIGDKTVGDISATDYGDKTFVANITSNPIFEVKYHHNYDGGPIVTRNVENGKTAIELKPTRTGYTFDKWYKDEKCTDVYDFATEIVSGNVDLYAHWTINTYKVTFYPIGGTLSGDAETSVEYNGTVTRPADPARDGYTFTGWVTDIESGTAYDFSAPVVADVKLYATWEINEYTVTFDANGGVFAGDTTVQAVHGSAIAAPQAPHKTGYTFVGWYTDNDSFAKKWDFAESKVTSAITLYAKFDIITYNITYVVGDGANGNNPATYKVSDDDFALLAPTAPFGYRFIGWYSAAENGDEVVALDTDIITRADADGNIKIYAVYSDVYTVTFDADGGELAQTTLPQNVKRGEKIQKPDDPTRSGYAFVGWKAQGGQVMWDFDANAMPANDLTIVAVWHENPKDGTYLFGTMTNWGNGVGDYKATLDAQGIKREYKLTGVPLEAGDEFILVAYDEDGNATDYIKAPANFTVYGADGVMTLVQSDVDGEGRGNYCVKTYDEAYVGMTWTIVLGVNEYGQNIVSLELERESVLRDPATGKESDDVQVVTPEDDVFYLMGNFSGGFKATDAWALGGNPRVKEINGAYYFTNVYLKKFDAFKLFSRSGDAENWYGGRFVEVGEKISLDKTIQSNVDLGKDFENGLYNIVVEYGEHKSVTIYKVGRLGATLAIDTIYAGDTIAKSDMSVTYHGEPISDYTLIASAATVGENTVTVIYQGNVAEIKYTATALTETAIEISKDPVKLVYSVGDELSLDGIRVTVSYNKLGYTQTVGADKLTASVERFTAAGEVEITVTLDGTNLSDKFTVTVGNKLTSVKVDTPPTKTVYYADDTALDLSGMVVIAYYNENIDGATVVTETVTDYTTNADAITFTAGEKTLIVAYGGKTANVVITVNALEITSVELDTANAKTEYKLGEAFVTNGITASATYNSGKTKPLALSEFTFAAGSYIDADNKFVGAKNGINVIATHTSGKTAAFTVNVAPLTVTFDANGGVLAGDGSVAVIMYADTVTEPTAPVRENYDFAEWQYNGEAWNFATDGVTADITLTAKWMPKTYSVAFEFGGGEYTAAWKDGYAAPVSYVYGTGLALPDADSVVVSTDGYNFLGWYLKGDTSAHVIEISANDSGDKTFVAHIEQADTVEFVFDYNYDGKTEKINVVQGTSAAAIAEPKREGYTFDGWYTAADHADGELYDFAQKVDVKTIVYAKWVINNYDVTFVYGYDDITSVKTVEYGAKVPVPTQPHRTGYTFGGWFDGAAEWAFDSDKMPSRDVTLTAKWTVNEYVVTFVNGDSTDTKTVAYGEKIAKPVDPVKDGYTFDGWFNGDVAWNFDTDVMPAGALTLTAEFTPVTYYIKYVNGTAETVAYTIDDMPIPLADAQPDDESKAFIGWYTAQVGGDKIEGEITHADFGGHLDNTITLYALFETKTYTVTFDTDGGSAVASATVEHGAAVARPTDPTRENYEFVQWDKDGVEYDFDAAVAQDITLVAQWRMTAHADGVYADGVFVKALVPDGDSATKLKVENVNLPADSCITFWKDNKQITEYVYVRGGVENGEMTGDSYSDIKVVVGGWFNIYYNPSNNSWENGLWVVYNGAYVAPELKEGDGLYDGSNELLATFAVNADGANELICEELTLAETTVITFVYNGAAQTVSIKSGCTLGEATDGNIELHSGVYAFYYNYVSNEVWIDGTPDAPVDPNKLLTYEAVGANGESAGWLVGSFGASGVTSFDFGKGYRMTKRLDNNEEQWYIERVFLSAGDEVKVRAGSRGYYENGKEVANTFDRGCSYIRGGTGKANVTTTSGTWDSAGNGNIKVNKDGYYTFYFKQMSDGTGPNIWLEYSAT